VQVSLENGLILAYDSRTLSTSGAKAQPKYTLSAHDGAAAALDINPHIRGCIATGGMDKLVKIWNITDEETEGERGRKREISLAASRDLGLVCPLPYSSKANLAFLLYKETNPICRARCSQPGSRLIPIRP
jgi:WD40 repeat protein